MIILSCSTRCFGQESLDGALIRIAWAGFHAVEVEAGGDRFDAIAGEEFEERLVAEELRLVALDAGPVVAGSAEEVLEAMAHLGRCAVRANELGASCVLFAAPVAGAGGGERLAGGLTRLLRATASVPVTYALRHERGTLIESPAAFVDLQARVGLPVQSPEPRDPHAPPRLALALDPAEAVLAGWDPVALLRAAGEPEARPRVGHVYFTDSAGGRRVPPGGGELDWEALAEALVRGGYSGAVSLRLEGGDPLYVESEVKEAFALAGEVFRGVS